MADPFRASPARGTPSGRASDPIQAPPASFRPGDVLGRYRLLTSIGRGGTGEVFRAEDTALGRMVAVKVLSLDRGTSPEHRARFEREARTAAAISHPNVVSVFDVGRQDGVPYLVQELVDGETISSMLEGGGLFTSSAAVAYAIQAAEGIAAAHALGVLHRDVKPSNLIIGRDRRLRVLDFGLAKTAPEAPPRDDDDSITRDGLVVGTAHYMSPQQAMGQPLDGRTDVFSLAIVLFEMLTGRRPFTGETPVDVMHAIIRLEAPPLPPDSPLLAAVAPIVAKALSKKPEARQASMLELARELTEALRTVSESGPTAALPPFPSTSWSRPTAQPPAARKRLLGWGVAAGLVLLALGAAFLRARGWGREAASLRPVQVTTNAGLDGFPSFSPDGRTLVYASDRTSRFEIYRRPLASGGVEMALTSDGQQNVEPVFSPDGETVAYHSSSRGGIWVVPSLGGIPRQLTTFGSRPAFSPDGRWIAFSSERLQDLSASWLGALPPATLFLVPIAGGEPRALTRPGVPTGGHSAPAWSPDGKRIAFSTYDRRTAEIWTVAPEGGAPARVAAGAGYRYDPVWAADGRSVLYCVVSRSWNVGIFRIAVSASGQPKGQESEVANLGLGTVKQLALSRDGTRMAYSSQSLTSNLWRVPVGENGATGEARPLTRETGRNSRPGISPDGQTLVFTKWRPGMTQDLWLMSLTEASATPRQRTTDPADDDMAVFTADGKRLVYLSDRKGYRTLWELTLDTGRERLLLDAGPEVDFPRASPDGRFVTFHSSRGGTILNLFLSEVGSSAPPRQITFDKERIAFACWSRDSSTLAVEVKRGDATQIGVLPRAGGEPELLTSGEGQRWPYSFSPDGERVAYARERDGTWNVFFVSRRDRREVQVTRNEKLDTYVRYPEWSPLGDEIVYESAETTGNVWIVEGVR